MHASNAEEIVVPNSAGVGRPLHRMPPNACDSHMHIFDPALPRAPGSTGHAAENANVDAYRRLQARLGMVRAVIVTPRYYGTDNTVTTEAIRALGPERTRGVAVVAAGITETALRLLRDAGIRGVRFTTPHVDSNSPLFDQAAALAPRLATLDMHLQLHWTVEQIVARADLMLGLPCTVVIDHMGRLPRGVGLAHPAYAILRRRLDDGRTWVKLSGWYLDDAAPHYLETVATGTAFARAAPERMVWGTDWPHVATQDKPDGAAMVDILALCVPDVETRKRILVDNPAHLYGFPD